MSGTFRSAASSRTAAANASLVFSCPARGGIVVRITTVPFFRHASVTARICFA